MPKKKMSTSFSPLERPPLPRPIERYLEKLHRRCERAVTLVKLGTVNKRLLNALLSAKIPHEVVALLDDLGSFELEVRWEGIIRAHYAQAVNYYSRAFDVSGVATLLGR